MPFLLQTKTADTHFPESEQQQQKQHFQRKKNKQANKQLV
jgi:hypothetical protein